MDIRNSARAFSLAIVFSLSAPAQALQLDQPAPATKQDYVRPVSWKLLVPNILSDQKAIWLFPRKLTQDHNWIPAAGVVGFTAALTALDPYEGRYFHNTTAFHGFNNVFSSNATAIGTIVAPVSLYAAGLVRKDSKMQHTALLAGEAVAGAEIVTTVFKSFDRRLRPADVPPHGNYWDTWTDGKGTGNGSFPSGHAVAAFAIATVVSHNYASHRWVPYVAYGAAALVSFSRLSLSAHYTSDVFFGGALGYPIARFAVLRY